MISVIIVTYNSRNHISQCLDSLKDSGSEVVVVDNASADGTAGLVRDGYPWVKLIASPRNLGFAGACNLGVSKSSGDALLFLNADVVCPGSLQPLEEALARHTDAAAIAPRLVDAQGRAQVGFNLRRLPTPTALLFEILLLNRFFPNNSVNRRYRCLDLNLDAKDSESIEVEQPAAACLLVRRSSFENCGGFDERFFPLWFEDVDLCLRLRQHGGKVLYWPGLTFQHAGGHSVESITFSERQVYWYRNLLYYGHKHFSWGVAVALRVALLGGMGLRIIAELPGLLSGSQSERSTRGERVCGYLKAARVSFLGNR